MGRAILTTELELTFYAVDGPFREHGDLAVGDEFEAALDLGHALQPRDGSPAVRSVTHLEANRYVVTGEVVFRGPRSIVIDFGVPAAGETVYEPVGDLLPGDAVQGTVTLRWLDDWRPVEERAEEEQWVGDLATPSAPPLTCRWRVLRLWVQTTPWKEIFRNAFIRDLKNGRTWAEIERTNWAGDDERHPEYFLECRLLQLPAEFSTDRLKP